MRWLTDTRLPAAGSCVPQARDLVDASGLGVEGELRDDLRLLVSELATNAVRHGTVDGTVSPAEIRIRVGVEENRVRVEVHDGGPGFEHRPRGPHARLDSGWGVHFVHLLADRWGAGRDPSGSWVVWFELGLPGPGGTADALRYGQRAGDGLPLEPEVARDREPQHQDLASAG